VAPRCPLIRIRYGTGAGSMTSWSRAGRWPRLTGIGWPAGA